MELTTRLLLCSALMATVCWSQDVQDWMQCTTTCKCKWVSGKKTAECIRQNLTQIPRNLSSEIQNLDFTGNRITYLPHDAFCSVNLVNLHRLVLRECGIETVHPEAFNGLKIVIEIDLSANKIMTLYPGTFQETQRLRVLLLNQNKVEVLKDGLFNDLMYLQKVILSENRLELIEENTFRNLPDLQSLTLSGNNLSTLKLRSFESLPKLYSLELQNNPWNCNCGLKLFRDWTIERKLYTKPTICQQPSKLAGKMWDEISSDEFACRPEIFSIGSTDRVQVRQGDVKLWCRASGVPQPELSWVYRSRVLNNLTRRHNGDRGYILISDNDWLNLTIPDAVPSDKGEYVCLAKSPGGNMERNVTLSVTGDAIGRRDSLIGLPLALALGVAALLLLVVAMALCACYCRRRRTHHNEKSLEAASLEHHGLGEQEKSLITTINSNSVKTVRRYETPSVTSHGTEMTELNRTLLDNDSVFADGGGGVGGGGGSSSGGGGGGGVGIGGGVDGAIMGIIGKDEMEDGLTDHRLDNSSGGTLTRGGGVGIVINYRQYPPDLLAFSGGRGASPTSQASTAPDNTRLPNQQHQQQHQQQYQQQQQQQQQQQHYGTINSSSASYGSPSGQYHLAAFKTLPHNRSVTPYGVANVTTAPVLPRHGYVTIPRRPRAPSWSSGPPTSPNDALEPVYDNLGLRTTADGSSVLSLNKSPDSIVSSMRGRPLPGTPTNSHYGTILQRSTPNILSSGGGITGIGGVIEAAGGSSGISPIDRSAPEGAPEWPVKLPDESTIDLDHHHQQQQHASGGGGTLARKIPPRPPPKPKKKSTNGPLYEDEGEDGTEV